MINEVIIVGLLKKESGFIQVRGKKYLSISIEVDKAFMSDNGTYEKDEIECLLWKGEADRLLAFNGDCRWLSVKGRLEKTDGNVFVMAEKVKFLDSYVSVK